MIDLIVIAAFQLAATQPPADERPQTPAPPPATATATTTQQPSDQQHQSTTNTNSEERRCRRELIVGTRISRRVCTTQHQEREMEDDARNAINRFQSQIPLQSN